MSGGPAMSIPPDDATAVADDVSFRPRAERLTSTVGAFANPDHVYRELAHMRTEIDLERQALLKSGLPS